MEELHRVRESGAGQEVGRACMPSLHALATQHVDAFSLEAPLTLFTEL